MTLKEFLAELAANAKADIGEGLLSRSDIEHLYAIFEDMRAKAAAIYLPVSLHK